MGRLNISKAIKRTVGKIKRDVKRGVRTFGNKAIKVSSHLVKEVASNIEIATDAISSELVSFSKSAMSVVATDFPIVSTVQNFIKNPKPGSFFLALAETASLVIAVGTCIFGVPEVGFLVDMGITETIAAAVPTIVEATTTSYATSKVAGTAIAISSKAGWTDENGNITLGNKFPGGTMLQECIMLGVNAATGNEIGITESMIAMASTSFEAATGIKTDTLMSAYGVISGDVTASEALASFNGSVVDDDDKEYEDGVKDNEKLGINKSTVTDIIKSLGKQGIKVTNILSSCANTTQLVNGNVDLNTFDKSTGSEIDLQDQMAFDNANPSENYLAEMFDESLEPASSMITVWDNSNPMSTEEYEDLLLGLDNDPQLNSEYDNNMYDTQTTIAVNSPKYEQEVLRLSNVII